MKIFYIILNGEVYKKAFISHRKACEFIIKYDPEAKYLRENAMIWKSDKNTFHIKNLEVDFNDGV